MIAPGFFLRRGVARVIDLLVQLALLEVAYRISKLLPEQGLLVLAEQTLAGVDLAVGLAVLIGYAAIAEWVGGATLGKQLLGLQVQTLEGTPPGFRAALVRNIALPVDGFLFGLVAYSAIARSPLRQRVGDQWGGTVVVPNPTPISMRTFSGWPLGIVFGLALLVGSYLVAR